MAEEEPRLGASGTGECACSTIGDGTLQEGLSITTSALRLPSTLAEGPSVRGRLTMTRATGTLPLRLTKLHPFLLSRHPSHQTPNGFPTGRIQGACLLQHNSH